MFGVVFYFGFVFFLFFGMAGLRRVVSNYAIPQTCLRMQFCLRMCLARMRGVPGFVAAFVMMALFSCGFLPGIVRFWNFPNMQWSTWCLASGFFAALLTFFLWRPQQPVFLDKICINEQENEQKCENIFSLAGILKRSDEASF